LFFIQSFLQAFHYFFYDLNQNILRHRIGLKGSGKNSKRIERSSPESWDEQRRGKDLLPFPFFLPYKNVNIPLYKRALSIFGWRESFSCPAGLIFVITAEE
jgi:hypothetical protein